MTRDYAKKKRPAAKAKKAAAKPQIPWWVWLFIGSMLGAFIMFLIYLAGLSPSQQPPAQQAAVPAPQTKPAEPTTEKEKNDLPKPRFDFYKLLQESEVIVPATEPVETTQTSTQEPAVEYLLQVGSFRKAEDADKLRAQLILLNLDARTEDVTIRDGELWHRVVVGPFDNQSRLAKARSTLVSNRYNALVLKRQPEG